MVSLIKMHQDDFDQYIAYAVKDYADDKVQAGTWAEEDALTLSKQAFNKYLPKGVESENEYLMSIVSGEEETKIGFFWFHHDKEEVNKTAFIYDFIILEPFQGKGYGTQTMLSFEALAKEMGIKKIGLHVFAHNKRALHLYEKVGFHATDITMAKYI